MIGTTIAHYRVEEKIGEGGMGEVYRAHDSKLNRDVALKILPQVFAQDSERMARFEREAQVLASLNHSHIAQIHGIEETAGTKALVLELVEGETLADQIVRGPIPVDEALKIALQITEGIEAAHEKGIIHRDLKPVNIKVTPEGQVKILDFGLAKAMEGSTHSADLSQSPTISMQATQAGIILGTASYMSPEQARGQPIDKRTDIWAFGCVLFEMLTGKKAFGGEDTTEILASIVKEEPNWSLLPRKIFGRIPEILRRCLKKEKELRWRDAGDVGLEVLGALEQLNDRTEFAASPLNRTRTSLIVILSLVAVCFVLVAIWSKVSEEEVKVRHLTICLPDTAPLASAEYLPLGVGQSYLAISPDGEQLVYVGIHEESTLLYLRDLSDPEITPIPGTEGGYSPFFSPDNRWLGFFKAGYLYKVLIEGGDPVPLCEARNSEGASWGRAGKIYFADRIGNRVSQLEVDSGEVTTITSADTGLLWPQVLPGGQMLLVTGNPRIYANIQVLDINTGEVDILIEGGTYARYSPTGHLLYSVGSSLFAVPFDVRSKTTSGSAKLLLQGIRKELFGASQFSFADDGTLVYVSGGMAAIAEPVLSDRRGNTQSLGLPADNYGPMAISPDGKLLAIVILDVEENIWIRDLERDISFRLTFEGNNSYPVWTPDSKKLIFSSDRTGNWDIWIKSIVGNSAPERLTVTSCRNTPWTVSSDGENLILVTYDSEANLETRSIDLTSKSSPISLKKPRFLEWGHDFSPDGSWVAYTSDESGTYEIFIEEFPMIGNRWQVSSYGGEEPIWSHIKDEVFFRNGSKLMRVSYTAKPEFKLNIPEVLFEQDFRTVWGRSFDVAPDGEHFLFLLPQKKIDRNQINLILNFSEQFRQGAIR